MPPRFYCAVLPDPALSEPACALDAEESRHARKVLRLDAGDPCELFDGRGTVADAQITGYVGGLAQCRVVEQRRVEAARPRLTVASAVPKGPRAEDMVNQLGQLGVDTFLPVRSERSVAEPGAGKRARYERAALAAAKQSGRATVMQITEVETLDRVLARPDDIKLILDPRGEAEAGTDLPGRLAVAESVVVLIGPEGGWSDAEEAAARDAGYARWKIAAHVLRIETAAVAAAAIVRQMTVR